ncbi:MAG TPA: hypothetical protein VMU95_31570 [Trebonia sp.]|nr:hypothetical protein [Trebonia sp.]
MPHTTAPPISSGSAYCGCVMSTFAVAVATPTVVVSTSHGVTTGAGTPRWARSIHGR